MRNRPRVSTPAFSSEMPNTRPTLPPASGSIGNGTPPYTIRKSSSSFHILWTDMLSTLADNTSTPNS